LAEPGPAELDRPRLLAALKPFLRGRGLQIDWQAIESTPDEQLINALAMICPFGPAEKQGLLLAVDLAARAQLLTSLVEMAVLEPPGGTARH
jgi:Lon protease-like protein